MGRVLEARFEGEMRNRKKVVQSGAPRTPIFEPTGNTGRLIDFAQENKVGSDYEEVASKLDRLSDRADSRLLPKFDRVFELMGVRG